MRPASLRPKTLVPGDSLMALSPTSPINLSSTFCHSPSEPSVQRGRKTKEQVQYERALKKLTDRQLAAERSKQRREYKRDTGFDWDDSNVKVFCGRNSRCRSTEQKLQAIDAEYARRMR